MNEIINTQVEAKINMGPELNIYRWVAGAIGAIGGLVGQSSGRMEFRNVQAKLIVNAELGPEGGTVAGGVIGEEIGTTLFYDSTISSTLSCVAAECRKGGRYAGNDIPVGTRKPSLNNSRIVTTVTGTWAPLIP